MPRKIIDSAAIDKIIALSKRGVAPKHIASQFGITPRYVNAVLLAHARKEKEAAK